MFGAVQEGRCKKEIENEDQVQQVTAHQDIEGLPGKGQEGEAREDAETKEEIGTQQDDVEGIKQVGPLPLKYISEEDIKKDA
jgi:hypothetical protein